VELAAGPSAQTIVNLCVTDEVDEYVVSRAETETSKIFNRMAIKLESHREDSRFCKLNPDHTIHVSFSVATPADVKPNALAYALPYEGVHLQIFYDRLLGAGSRDVNSGNLLAYALAHEIGHILQGVARHSDSGIMKARWEKTDYMWMRFGMLRFSDEDVRLIQRGIDGWNRRTENLVAASRTGLVETAIVR